MPHGRPPVNTPRATAAGRRDVLAFWGEFSSPWPGMALLVAAMALLHRAAEGKGR